MAVLLAVNLPFGTLLVFCYLHILKFISICTTKVSKSRFAISVSSLLNNSSLTILIIMNGSSHQGLPLVNIYDLA